jgi:hypothetical protein
MSSAVVTKVRFEGTNGGCRGIGARVTLPCGWTMTFMGPAGKRVLIRLAEWHKARGTKSE